MLIHHGLPTLLCFQSRIRLALTLHIIVHASLLLLLSFTYI